MRRSGFLLIALLSLTFTLTAQIPEAPERWINDPIGTLNIRRSESLQQHIERTHLETGISIHVVTYSSLPERELASARASQLLDLWSDAELGGLIVYVENPERLAVATSRTATREDEDGALRTLASRANMRLAAGGNPAQILRETTLELDYVLRAIHRRQQTSFFVQYPLHLLWTGAGVLAAILLLMISLGQARHHNLFGQSIIFPEQSAPQRLGGNRSGGHSAGRSFKS